MAFQFFDSSSLVKKYIGETGTNWVRNLFNAAPAHEIYVSRITEVEATAAIVRRRKSGSLSASDAALALQQLRSDFLIRFRILDVAAIVSTQACAIAEAHALRGYDAVQLASAIHIYNRLLSLGANPSQISFTFISSDNELNSAAQIEGLTVENPNNYP
jgi:predicted nucleic acid-binding protein